MTTYSIFLIDDEQVSREGVALVLRKHYRVQAFETAEAAITALDAGVPTWFFWISGFQG